MNVKEILFFLILCISFYGMMIESFPADILNDDEQTIFAGNAGGASIPPIIGETNAGIGATIDVTAINHANEKEASDTPPILTIDDFKAKSVKQLKAFLKERGLECKGCSEKADFVKLAFDNRETPLTETSSSANDTANSNNEKKSKVEDVPDGGKIDQEKLDELMASLKRGGFGNNNIFTAEDLKNLSPEEMNAKFNNPNYRPKASSKNSKKPSSSDKDKSSKKKSSSKKEKESASSSSSSSGSSSGGKKAESKPKTSKTNNPKPKPPPPPQQTTTHIESEEEAIEL